MAAEIEHGDRECPPCGALPGEWCTLLHDKRVSLQPLGRSHPERAGFQAVAASTGAPAMAPGAYDPVPDLIGYLVASRRSQTKRAAHLKGRVMDRLGITDRMDEYEAEELVRQAIKRAREHMLTNMPASMPGDKDGTDGV